MAEPKTSSAKTNDAPGADAISDDERKKNAQSIAHLGEFLRHYSPPREHKERDMLDDRYRINLASPLPLLSVQNATAYAVSDITTPTRQLFAHVCERGTFIRSNVVAMLNGIEHRSIIQMVAAGTVDLSRGDEERFVVVYERPAGQKLSAWLTQKKMSLNPHFICTHILAPLAAALQKFSELDISHGLLNPDNIYFDEHAMLGPCAIEPCGYSQPYMYEPLERMQAMQAGKGEGSTAHDYYALAVTALYVIHGAAHFAGLPQERLMQHILREGAYAALMRQQEVPEIFYDFFRGILTQNASDRWNDRQITPWLSGKRYNVLPPTLHIDALRPFEFGDTRAVTRRELAHLFAMNWERMVAMLQNNKLSHWVSISLRNKELAELIGRMSRTVTEPGTRTDAQISEALMNIVLLLDPQGPLRIKSLSMNIDGMDSLCVEMHAQMAHQNLQFLAGFIENDMVNYWLPLQTKRNPEYAPSSAVKAMLAKLDKLRSYIRNSGFGFGLERILYDLNPNMHCMSPLLAKSYIHTLPALLRQLDRMAPSIAGDDIIDRHIAAFIANKLAMQYEIRLNDLSAIPAMASNRNIVALYLLGLVQEKHPTIKVPGLTHWLAIRLLPLADAVHSRTLRYKVKGLIQDVAPQGYLQRMAEIIISSDYASTDKKGFQQAINRYQRNASEISALQMPGRLEEESSRMGLKMATSLAYMGMAISVLMVIRGIL